jgi:hypothetical protein
MPEQLLLDLNNSIKKFSDASTEVVDSLQLIYQSNLPKQQKRIAKKLVSEKTNSDRKRLNKMIKTIALQKRLTPREIWILAYERLRESTGFNAMVKGLENGVIPLDAVYTYGKQKDLIKTVGAM